MLTLERLKAIKFRRRNDYETQELIAEVRMLRTINDYSSKDSWKKLEERKELRKKLAIAETQIDKLKSLLHTALLLMDGEEDDFTRAVREELK